MIVAISELEPKECTFKWLCEEVYPEHDMVEKRKQCTDENCRKCTHFWNFYEGYFSSDD